MRDLTALVRDNVDNDAIRAPLALPAQDPWSLTDWFENQLVSLAPELYDRLADRGQTDWDHDEVREALSNMAALWRIPGVFVGGPKGAKDTQWEDVARQLGEGDAALGFVPSFLAGEIDRLPLADRPEPSGFPRASRGRGPLVVGGDVAVVPRGPGSSEGQRFVEWLTNDKALRLWSDRDPGFLTPNARTPYRWDAQPPPKDTAYVQIFLTALLRPGSKDTPVHFDLSDQLGDTSQAQCGIWQTFAAFFDDVAVERRNVNHAIERVIERLEATARGEALPELGC